MEERLTEELLDELLSSSTPSEYLASHPTGTRDLATYLNEMLVAHGKERNEVIRTSNLDQTYGYQIFTGKRANPSRNKVLQIAFGLGLSPRETDRALQAAGASRLYCKDRRDAIIIFCLDRHVSLQETNETLYSLGEEIVG